MIITTQTGSKYRIDEKSKSWERLESTGLSGKLRGESGEYLAMDPVVVGRSMTILCPPLHSEASARLIHTSRVIRIEEDAAPHCNKTP